MILINAHILTAQSPPIVLGFIEIENQKVKSIGPMEALPIVNDQETLDLQGKFACPGFVDSHTHIGMWETAIREEGDDGNESNSPIMPQLRAIDAVNPQDQAFMLALSRGVTTVATGPGSANPIGGQFVAMKTAGVRIDQMAIKSCCAMKFAFGENPKLVHRGKKHVPSTRMGTAALIREYLMKTQHYISNGGTFDMKLEALVPVVHGSLLVKAHAHRADDIFTAIRIRNEFNLNMTIEHCTDGHLIGDHLAEEQIGVCQGPFMTHNSKPEMKNLSYKTANSLMEKGINLSIITDHPVTHQQELLLCAQTAVREGMDKESALEAITINGAKNLGLDNRVGSLAAGKDADVLVFTGHPMDFSSKCQMVLVDGAIVHRL